MCKQEGAIDLHAHTCCSDGTLTPTELVALAAEKGLKALAVTDHDTTAGINEALAAGETYGVRVIPGIEMSANMDGCDVHLVGLFVNPENCVLQAQLKEALEARSRRNERAIAQLAAAGFDIREEDFETLGKDKVLTRGNIAEVLVQKGYAGSVKEAMNQYLVRGKVGYAKRDLPEPDECIRILHQAGALVFVAHLHQIDRRDLQHSVDICRGVLRLGADGLETIYSEFDDSLRELSEEIARSTGCLRSGGSDFHGTLKKGLELGTGYGDLFVPEHFLKEIEKRRG